MDEAAGKGAGKRPVGWLMGDERLRRKARQAWMVSLAGWGIELGALTGLMILARYAFGPQQWWLSVLAPGVGVAMIRMVVPNRARKVGPWYDDFLPFALPQYWRESLLREFLAPHALPLSEEIAQLSAMASYYKSAQQELRGSGRRWEAIGADCWERACEMRLRVLRRAECEQLLNQKLASMRQALPGFSLLERGEMLRDLPEGSPKTGRPKAL